MQSTTIAHPPVVSREVWLQERKALLAEEKELTRHYDRVNAKRRRLPMVKLDKEYVFDGPRGKTRLLDLFEGRHQLIVYHFICSLNRENWYKTLIVDFRIICDQRRYVC